MPILLILLAFCLAGCATVYPLPRSEQALKDAQRASYKRCMGSAAFPETLKDQAECKRKAKEVKAIERKTDGRTLSV